VAAHGSEVKAVARIEGTVYLYISTLPAGCALARTILWLALHPTTESDLFNLQKRP